jgi:hypothetical protein
MRRREDRAIAKHTLNLYLGDYQALQVYYGSRIGAAKIIRDIVHIHVKRIKAKAEQTTETLVEDPLALTGPELEGLFSKTEEIK